MGVHPLPEAPPLLDFLGQESNLRVGRWLVESLPVRLEEDREDHPPGRHFDWAFFSNGQLIPMRRVHRRAAASDSSLRFFGWSS